MIEKYSFKNDVDPEKQEMIDLLRDILQSNNIIWIHHKVEAILKKVDPNTPLGG